MISLNVLLCQQQGITPEKKVREIKNKAVTQGLGVRQGACAENYKNCLNDKGGLTRASCPSWIHWIILG